MVLRVMDCFFFEGHKVLFRVALAKLKLFYKSVSDKKELYQTSKKDGLYPTFSSHSKNLSVSPDELLKIAFKFPRFSKADIAKLTAKLDMEAKANRLKRTGRRTRSSEDLGDTGSRHLATAFSTPQHRPAGAYPVHHLVSEILSKEQVIKWINRGNLKKYLLADSCALGRTSGPNYFCKADFRLGSSFFRHGLRIKLGIFQHTLQTNTGSQ